MRKSYFITALAVCLALVTAQAQEAVVKRTTTRKAAKMAPSERFVRVAKARGGEGTVVQKAATLPITPDWECKFDKEADFSQFTVIDSNNDRFRRVILTGAHGTISSRQVKAPMALITLTTVRATPVTKTTMPTTGSSRRRWH